MSWLMLLLFYSFNALAQTELEAIEVEASKDLQEFSFAPTYEIQTREIETEPTGLAVYSMERTPGIVIAQNGGPGGRTSFFIRGTESRHVSFTIDGLKVNDTSNTDRQFDAAFLTSAFIKSITIHKGPQAVLYGSDALGGVVEINTRKGESAPETRLTLNAGSFGTVASSLSSDWKSSSNQGTLTLTHLRTDGISRLNSKRFDATERDGADITQVMSSSEHRWTQKVQTDILVSYLHGKSEQDGFVTDNSNDYQVSDQYILQQKTSLEIDKNQAISLRNGFNRHQRNNENLVSGSEFFNGHLFQNEIIHRLDTNKFNLLSGISTDRESAKIINLDKHFDLYSVFIQSSFNLSDFKFQLGGRSDIHSKYGSFITGSGGISYHSFSFQYSQGYKAPSLYQLYGPDSFGAPVGNPDLVPEVNHSMEFSWRQTGEILRGGVTLFQNRLANQFTYSFTEGYLNQQRFITEGIEFDAGFKLTNYEISSSFTHQQFRDEDTPVLRRPYNIGKMSLSYFPIESLETNLTGRWFSSRKDFGLSGITKLNSFEVFDFSIRKTWERDDITLQLKNILNREYEEIYGFSVLPRSVFVNYGHRF